MGKRLTALEREALRVHRRVFSQIGGALLAQMGGMLLVQSAVQLVVGLLAPRLMSEPLFFGMLSLLSAYAVGFPLFWLVIRRAPAPPLPEGRRVFSPARFFRVYLISMAALYLTNFATLRFMALIGRIMGTQPVNPVDTLKGYPVVLNLLLACVVAPVTEEIMFRGMLLRRLRPYGEKFAVLASSLCFALFHGNLNQMFYAFSLGLIFAYVALRTNCLWQCMLLHAAVNFAASGFIPLLERLGRQGVLLAAALVLLSVLGGTICFIAAVRGVCLRRGGCMIPEGRKWRLFFQNPGMLCFCLLAAGMAALYLIV